MEYEYFTSIMTPGIALLILSTTMRLGNVRLALTELAKTPNVELESMESYLLFSNRAKHLCRGLRLLNISMLFIIPSALGQLLFQHKYPVVDNIILFLDIIFFLVLFSAVYFLFKESQLTGRSIITHTSEIRAAHNK